MARILIVDDEPEIRRVLEQILVMQGYDCTLAASAAEARECLKNRQFELVLSDIKMPGESGIDLISHVFREYRDTAAVIVTFIDDLSVAEIALELGVYGFIIKPFRPQGVLISVSDALRRRQLEIDNRMYRLKMERMLSAHTDGPLGSANIRNNLKQLGPYVRESDKIIKLYRKFVDDLQKRLPKKTLKSLSGSLDDILTAEREIKLNNLFTDAQKALKELPDSLDRPGKSVLNLIEIPPSSENLRDVIDINETIESALDAAWPELKDKAAIRREYGKVPLIRGNTRGLYQVFMNILVNAAQAIPDKGEVRIITEADNRHVNIKISDTGVGIPAHSLAKIYDPFYTTKDGPKAVGLGLNIVQNIVQKHQGAIEVESEPGRGTTFTIQLPINMPS